MDPLTQGLLGAALPQSLAGKDELRRATLVGFTAGMAADLDILIQSSQDPLLFLDYHRHFTHSLLFIPVGAFLTALPLFFLLRRKIPFLRTWFLAVLGYGTHGLLDACTSYGTQLFWPFSSARIAWSNVAVVDPFLTLPLALLVIFSFFKRSPNWARAGLAFVLVYLLFGVVQRERAATAVAQQARTRGHHPVRLEVKPSLGNVWLWRAIYQDSGNYYIDAVWTLPGTTSVYYEGGNLAVFDPKRDSPNLVDGSVQQRDLLRFTHFSSGFIALHPQDPAVVGDVRYALLPHQLTPLWGIRLTPETPNQHVSFHNFRQVNDRTWIVFGRMLRGAPL